MDMDMDIMIDIKKIKEEEEEYSTFYKEYLYLYSIQCDQNK